MPLTEHEEPNGMIESFVKAFADALDIEVRKLGALTLEREDLTRDEGRSRLKGEA